MSWAAEDKFILKKQWRSWCRRQGCEQHWVGVKCSTALNLQCRQVIKCRTGANSPPSMACSAAVGLKVVAIKRSSSVHVFSTVHFSV
jgi:hypothetical protein